MLVQRLVSMLSPDPEGVVPATSTHGSPVWRDPQAAHPVLMAVQHGQAMTLQGVPNVDRVVVVSDKEQAPCGGRCTKSKLKLVQCLASPCIITKYQRTRRTYKMKAVKAYFTHNLYCMS